MRLRIGKLKGLDSGFTEYMNYGITLLSNLPYYYSTATLEGKQQMISSIFPEKLIYCENTYRTAQPSELLTFLCYENKGNKKGQIASKSNLSCLVAHRGIEPLFPG